MSFHRELSSLFFSSSYPAAAQSELCLLQERPWALDSGNPLHEGDSRHKPAIEAHARDKAAIVALKIVKNLYHCIIELGKLY